MSDKFIRTGGLMVLDSYPSWAGDLVGACAGAKRRVVEHEFFQQMRDAELSAEATRNFLVGIWPVIDQFPQYMAMNLLKVRYGRTRGQDMARRYLVRNIRIEQNHAEHWVEWAAASGVDKDDLINGQVPPEMHTLSHWCWNTCEQEILTVGMAATNYAIEGATGEWATLVCSSNAYENTFDAAVRRKAMKWLKMHAHYDDEHPWEALDIICTIIGHNPTARAVEQLQSSIRQSYDYMRLALDHCYSSERASSHLSLGAAERADERQSA